MPPVARHMRTAITEMTIAPAQWGRKPGPVIRVGGAAVDCDAVIDHRWGHFNCILGTD